MHTGSTAFFPWLVHHSVPTIHLPLNFPPFSYTQVLPCMFQIWSHHHIWMQLPTLSPTVWSDSSSTPAPEALLLGGWHTHWRPTTTLQLPLAMFCSCTHTHLHLWPDHAAFGPAHPSLPRAVWPTTGPKGHPSGWLVHPLSAHHHLPSPSGTPCMCAFQIRPEMEVGVCA